MNIVQRDKNKIFLNAMQKTIKIITMIILSHEYLRLLRLFTHYKVLTVLQKQFCRTNIIVYIA